MGKKTLSIELAYARGSEFADQFDSAEIKRRRCPKYLAKHPDVKRVWLQCEKLLREAGIMCEIYYLGLEILVQSWRDWKQYDDMLKEEDLAADERKLILDMRTQAWAELAEQCESFGGYPSEEQGITFLARNKSA
jgi:hypothetical protein